MHHVPAAFVYEQIRQTVEDLRPDAVKTGMLGSREVVLAVCRAIDDFALLPLVADPVMVATTGQRLLEAEAEVALRDELMPRAILVTPNAPEAAVLTGRAVADLSDLEPVARMLVDDLGARAALVKGGDLPGATLRDVFYDGHDLEVFEQARIATRSTHGSGCTLASAIAAFLARGKPLAEAVRRGRAFTRAAIASAFPLGSGNGPLNHFIRFDPD